MEASQHIGIYVSMGGEIGTESLIRSVIALSMLRAVLLLSVLTSMHPGPRKVCYVPYIPKDLSDMRMMEVCSASFRVLC